jgi:predicted amidohydrolase
MTITRILLLGALLMLIGTAFPALAATKHHPVTHVHRAIYNMVPDTSCPANGGPTCSNAGHAAVEY